MRLRRFERAGAHRVRVVPRLKCLPELLGRLVLAQGPEQQAELAVPAGQLDPQQKVVGRLPNERPSPRHCFGERLFGLLAPAQFDVGLGCAAAPRGGADAEVWTRLLHPGQLAARVYRLIEKPFRLLPPERVVLQPAVRELQGDVV